MGTTNRKRVFPLELPWRMDTGIKMVFVVTRGVHNGLVVLLHLFARKLSAPSMSSNMELLREILVALRRDERARSSGGQR